MRGLISNTTQSKPHHQACPPQALHTGPQAHQGVGPYLSSSTSVPPLRMVKYPCRNDGQSQPCPFRNACHLQEVDFIGGIQLKYVPQKQQRRSITPEIGHRSFTYIQRLSHSSSPTGRKSLRTTQNKLLLYLQLSLRQTTPSLLTMTRQSAPVLVTYATSSPTDPNSKISHSTGSTPLARDSETPALGLPLTTV